MSFKAKTQKKTTELRELTIDVRTEANGKSLNNDRVKELFQKIQDTKVTGTKPISYWSTKVDEDKVKQPRIEELAKQLEGKIINGMDDKGNDHTQPIIVFEKWDGVDDYIVDGKTTIVCGVKSVNIKELSYKLIPRSLWSKYTKREIENVLLMFNPEEELFKNPTSEATHIEFLYEQYKAYGQEPDGNDTIKYLERNNILSKNQQKIINKVKMRIKEIDFWKREEKVLIDYQNPTNEIKKKLDNMHKGLNSRSTFFHIQSSKSATVMKSIKAASKAGYTKVHVGLYASDFDTARLDDNSFQNSKGMKDFIWEDAWHKTNTPPSKLTLTWERLDGFRKQRYAE